jgi:hypothetical protein
VNRPPHGIGLVDAGDGDLNVRVGGDGLSFQIAQSGIVENVPPISASGGR